MIPARRWSVVYDVSAVQQLSHELFEPTCECELFKSPNITHTIHFVSHSDRDTGKWHLEADIHASLLLLLEKFRDLVCHK